MIALIYAHPYPKHSRANKALLKALHGLPNIHVRKLYELYPDFHIDVAAEQAQLAKCQTLVLQHPVQWYHTPALLSLWFEKVLAYGWAYGSGPGGEHAHALRGKRMLWAATAGGEKQAYCKEGYNHFSMDQISTPIQQTALFCGMDWLEPFTVFNAGKISDADLLLEAERYRDRLVEEIGILNTRPVAAQGASHAW